MLLSIGWSRVIICQLQRSNSSTFLRVLDCFSLPKSLDGSSIVGRVVVEKINFPFQRFGVFSFTRQPTLQTRQTKWISWIHTERAWKREMNNQVMQLFCCWVGTVWCHRYDGIVQRRYHSKNSTQITFCPCCAGEQDAVDLSCKGRSLFSKLFGR